MKKSLIFIGCVLIALSFGSCSKSNEWNGVVATSITLTHTDYGSINGHPTSNQVDWTFEIQSKDPYPFTWVISFSDGTTLKSSDLFGDLVLDASSGKWFTIKDKSEQIFTITITDSHKASSVLTGSF